MDRGVNDEDFSLEDPEQQAKEQEMLESIMMESAKCYNVSSVLKVSLSLIPLQQNFYDNTPMEIPKKLMSTTS